MLRNGLFFFLQPLPQRENARLTCHLSWCPHFQKLTHKCPPRNSAFFLNIIQAQPQILAHRSSPWAQDPSNPLALAWTYDSIGLHLWDGRTRPRAASQQTCIYTIDLTWIGSLHQWSNLLYFTWFLLDIPWCLPLNQDTPVTPAGYRKLIWWFFFFWLSAVSICYSLFVLLLLLVIYSTNSLIQNQNHGSHRLLSPL